MLSWIRTILDKENSLQKFSSWTNKAKGNRKRDTEVSYETSINALACPLELCSWLQNGAESFLRLPTHSPPGQDRTTKKTQVEFVRRQHDLTGGTPQQSKSPGGVRPSLALVLRSIKKYNILGFFPQEDSTIIFWIRVAFDNNSFSVVLQKKSDPD